MMMKTMKMLCTIVAIIAALYLIEDILLVYALSQNYISEGENLFNLDVPPFKFGKSFHLWR